MVLVGPFWPLVGVWIGAVPEFIRQFLEKLSDKSQVRASLLAIRRLIAAYTKASELSGSRS